MSYMEPQNWVKKGGLFLKRKFILLMALVLINISQLFQALLHLASVLISKLQVFVQIVQSNLKILQQFLFQIVLKRLMQILLLAFPLLQQLSVFQLLIRVAGKAVGAVERQFRIIRKIEIKHTKLINVISQILQLTTTVVSSILVIMVKKNKINH